MLVVTTDEIHGWDVQRVCGEVIGVVVRVAGADDPTRADAIGQMLEQARAKGGNVVVGLRLDSTGVGEGRVEVCAYGTAVVAVPVDDGARQTATSLGYGQPAAAAEPAVAQRYGQPQYGQHPGQPGYQQYPQQGYPQQ